MAEGAYLYDLPGLTPYGAALRRPAGAGRRPLAAGDPRHGDAARARAGDHARLARGARPRSCRCPTAEYAERGIEIVAVRRGGRSTYHGPGQLVCYPILDLTPRGRDLHRYVRGLERTIVRHARRVRRRGPRARRAAPERRVGGRPQDRLDRRALRALGDEPRLAAERRPRPGRVRALRRLRPGRRAVHLDRRRDRAGRSRPTTCASRCSRALCEAFGLELERAAGGRPCPGLSSRARGRSG